MADPRGGRKLIRLNCLTCGAEFASKPSSHRKYCSRRCQPLDGPNNPNWRGGPITLTCLFCTRTFLRIPALASVKYCSRSCRVSAALPKRGSDNPRWRGGPEEAKNRYRVKKGLPPLVARETPRRKQPPKLCKGCGRTGVRKGLTYHPGCRPKPKSHRMEVTCADCGKVRLSRKPSVRCRPCGYKSRGGAGNSRWRGGITPESRRLRNSEQYKRWRLAVFQRDRYTCVWCGQIGGRLNADHIQPFSTHPDLRFELSNGRTLCEPCHKLTPSYLNKGRKMPGKHSTPEQIRFQNAVAAAGGLALEVHSSDELMKELEGM